MKRHPYTPHGLMYQLEPSPHVDKSMVAANGLSLILGTRNWSKQTSLQAKCEIRRKALIGLAVLRPERDVDRSWRRVNSC